MENYPVIRCAFATHTLKPAIALKWDRRLDDAIVTNSLLEDMDTRCLHRDGIFLCTVHTTCVPHWTLHTECSYDNNAALKTSCGFL